MPRKWIRALAGSVMLPVYLVASNYCLLGDSLDHGCGQDAGSHDGCVSSQPVAEYPHDSDTYHSEPAAQHSRDHAPPEADPAAPCCDVVANALLPGGIKVAVASHSASFDAVTPQLTLAPDLLDLGEAVILSGASPPTRAAPARRSRAPPVA